MGNCCIKLFSLFDKRERHTESEPILANDPLFVPAENIVAHPRIISPLLEAQSAHCQESSPRLSIGFSPPKVLGSSDRVKSEQNSTQQKRIPRKAESDEEGYGSSFEAVASSSKDMAARKESKDEGTSFDDAAKENYEAEVRAALESILDDAKLNEKQGESESTTADVDYYSI